MGGAAGGDIASSIAVARLAALDDEALGPDEALDELKMAISDAHSQIVARAENDPELSGLGTTVTAMLRSGNTITMAHIGDSRAYLLREGHLDQVTTDHSFVQHLVDTGRLSAADAESHPKRSMLLRVLGDIDADVPVDVSARETRAGDRWLLCSDGLSGVVSKQTMQVTMREAMDPGECADTLVALALAAGAPDNVTCIVADVVDIDAAPGGVGPSTSSQVVGAAALDRKRPTAAGPSAAGRAASLTAPKDAKDDDHAPREGGWWSKVRAWALPLAVAIFIVIAAWASYVWTQTQYYVGTEDGAVVIYQGIPSTLGPFELSHVVERTAIDVDDLPAYERERINATIRKSSLDEAQAVVDGLEATG